MRWCCLIPSVVWLACCPAGAATNTPADQSASAERNIATFAVTNYGTTENNLVVTFGSPFARDDVPVGTSLAAIDRAGNSLPLQIDAKATNQDKSLRHAVITLVIPHLASGTTLPVTLREKHSIHADEPPIIPSDLPPNFDLTVSLTANGARFTVSARALLAQGKPEIWLSGPLVSEWWVSGPPRDDRGDANPHLNVEIGIRCYGKNRPLRLEVVVENDWTFVPDPQTELYDVEIRAGSKTLFSKAAIVQPSHTRWRKGFWWDQPINVYVAPNLSYLKRARVIPNYESGLKISKAALTHLFQRLQTTNREPMGAGIVEKYMPTTGTRPDIGPLPQWQALYLLCGDTRAYEATLQSADFGASFRVHYRNEKTGRPVTPENYPAISTNENLIGKPGQPPRPDNKGFKEELVPDQAHQPTLDFIPYVVTGDRFYLEELQFWSQWNTLNVAPEYRGYIKGLISWGEVRGQAWSLRTLAQAEYITPDADPLKSVLQRQLASNIEWYEKHFAKNPNANKLGTIFDADKTTPWDDGRAIAPWQDDFFTWSVGYVQQLGDVDALQLLRWKAAFPVGRMISPGYCWVLATPYTLIVRDIPQGSFYGNFSQAFDATISARIGRKADNLPCGSKQMAKALGLSAAGEMVSHAETPDGYSASLQAALAAAVDSHAVGATKAWQTFMERPVKPDFSGQPGWDIVPWDKIQ